MPRRKTPPPAPPAPPPSVPEAAWRLVQQIKRLHLWKNSSLQCGCELCKLARTLQSRLLAEGFKEPT